MSEKRKRRVSHKRGKKKRVPITSFSVAERSTRADLLPPLRGGLLLRSEKTRASEKNLEDDYL
ncbi:MAG: hypothetical protein ACTSXA_12660 [Candidatus Heimdallarchaeota archaeon]